MTPLYFNKVAVLGHGRIGQAIKTYLSNAGYLVDAFDVKPQDGVLPLDPNQQSAQYFAGVIEPYDAVVTATPYHLNIPIATAAIEKGVAYFDLTEDIAVAEHIRAMARVEKDNPLQDKHVWVMPQCGLAPGAVNTIARDMARRFDDIQDINIRVGALPITTNNQMKYYLTWSSEGLINEYCKPGEVLFSGKKVMVQPLEGYEELIIDGLEYEAFNTSGGAGTLIDTLLTDGTKVQNINYKTLRYKGHRDLMRFLLDDLGLAKRQSVLVDIFNAEVPHVTTDVVVIFIQVTGRHNGVLTAETYHRKIYGDAQFTAIQRTTALGACAAIHYWATKDWGTELAQWDINNVYIKAPEHIALADLVDSPFWSVYK